MNIKEYLEERYIITKKIRNNDDDIKKYEQEEVSQLTELFYY